MKKNQPNEMPEMFVSGTPMGNVAVGATHQDNENKSSYNEFACIQDKNIKFDKKRVSDSNLFFF